MKALEETQKLKSDLEKKVVPDAPDSEELKRLRDELENYKKQTSETKKMVEELKSGAEAGKKEMRDE